MTVKSGIFHRLRIPQVFIEHIFSQKIAFPQGRRDFSGWHVFSTAILNLKSSMIMEPRDSIRRNNRHYNHEGIGTITALLTIITLSIIFVSILSVI